MHIDFNLSDHTILSGALSEILQKHKRGASRLTETRRHLIDLFLEAASAGQRPPLVLSDGDLDALSYYFNRVLLEHHCGDVDTTRAVRRIASVMRSATARDPETCRALRHCVE